MDNTSQSFVTSRAEARRLKRRVARAANVYRVALASRHDITEPPLIRRAYRFVYVWLPRYVVSRLAPEQTTKWRAKGGGMRRMMVSEHRFKVLHADQHQLVRVERTWVVESNVQGITNTIWNDLLCAQAQRDAMQVNYSRYLMLQHQGGET